MRSSSGMVLPKDGAKKKRLLNNRSTKGMFSKMAKALVLINTDSALEVAKNMEKVEGVSEVIKKSSCIPTFDMLPSQKGGLYNV
jgi:hypothetical protein